MSPFFFNPEKNNSSIISTSAGIQALPNKNINWEFISIIKLSIFDLKKISIVNVLIRNLILRSILIVIGFILLNGFQFNNANVNLILCGMVFGLVLYKFSKIKNLKVFIYMFTQFIVVLLGLYLFWYLIGSGIVLLLSSLPEFIWINGDLEKPSADYGSHKESSSNKPGPNKPGPNDNPQTIHKAPDSSKEKDLTTTESSSVSSNKSDNKNENAYDGWSKPNKADDRVSDRPSYVRYLVNSLARSDGTSTADTYRSLVGEGLIDQTPKEKSDFYFFDNLERRR